MSKDYGSTNAYNLMPAGLKKVIPAMGGQEKLKDDAIIYVKYFLPVNADTFWATEFDGEDRFFGIYYMGQMYDNYEWGYFSLSEMVAIDINPLTGKVKNLASNAKRRGVGIERDLYFEPCTVGHMKHILDKDVINCKCPACVEAFPATEPNPETVEEEVVKEEVPPNPERVLPPIYLAGHYSVEDAYYIDDYPSGYDQRCNKRIWIEEIQSGASRGKWRKVYQTALHTKGRKFGPWRAKKMETGADLVILYLDEKGHQKSETYHDMRGLKGLQNFMAKHEAAFAADPVLFDRGQKLLARYGLPKPKATIASETTSESEAVTQPVAPKKEDGEIQVLVKVKDKRYIIPKKSLRDYWGAG